MAVRYSRMRSSLSGNLVAKSSAAFSSAAPSWCWPQRLCRRRIQPGSWPGAGVCPGAEGLWPRYLPAPEASGFARDTNVASASITTSIAACFMLSPWAKCNSSCSTTAAVLYCERRVGSYGFCNPSSAAALASGNPEPAVTAARYWSIAASRSSCKSKILPR